MGVELIQVPEALSSSGNKIYFKVRAGNYAATDHRLTVVIWVENTPNSNTFTSLPEMNLDTDNGGYADIDIARIIYRRMKNEIPDINNSQVHQLLKLTLRFKLIFTETWNGQTATKETSIFTSVRSRINFNLYPFQKIADWLTEKNYLTQSDSLIETYPGSIHYLTCLFKTPGKYIFKLRAYYNDQTQVEQILSTQEVLFANCAYIIPAGLRHRNLAIANKTLTKYEILVTDETNNIIFKKVTFQVTYESRKCLIYVNRLGGIDTFFIEKQTNTLKIEKENYLQYLPENYSGSDANILSDTTEIIDSYEANSGYISRKQQELSKELLISDSVSLVTTHSFVAVNIEKGSFNLYSDSDDLYYTKFKYNPRLSGDFLLPVNRSISSYSINDYNNNDYE